MGGLLCFFVFAKNSRFRERLLRLTLMTVLAIFLMELYTNYRNSGSVPSGILGKTMQAFSLDVDYDELFSVSSQTAAQKTNKPDVWQKVLQWYRAALYSVAPIIGGAVIYDVLAGVSPYLRLFFLRRRRLYVFSALNEKSLCLAQSIERETRQGRAPVLIFADCPQTDTEETKAELLQRAKELRAICLPDSLPDCNRLRQARQCVFFLIGCDEFGRIMEDQNLAVLHKLLSAEKPCWPERRGCHIFCFSNQSAAVESVRACKAAYDEKRRKDPRQGEVLVHVVCDYAQCASMLMYERPLFSVLSEKKKGEPLRVLVVGNNAMARELFKTVFWCGQILDHPLQLAAAYTPRGSDVEKTELERWLDSTCPELLNSCTEGDDCLRVSFAGGFNEPYASLCFTESSRDGFFNPRFLTEAYAFQYGSADQTCFRDFDYFILAMENDADNISLADHLWRELVYLEKNGSDLREKTIAVRIESEAHSEIQCLHAEELKKKEARITMVPFGNIAERFCCENVFTDGIRQLDRVPERSVTDMMHSLPGMDATKDDFYNEWSDHAREVHLPYKMFSALHRMPNADDVMGNIRYKLDYCEMLRENENLFQRLSWLEHRRWCAFLRTEGFRRPPRLTEKLCELLTGHCDESWESLSLYAYKHVPARMHPNLVESFCEENGKERDLLDAASDMRDYVKSKRGEEKSDRDLKYYDKPTGEYGPCFSRAEVSRYLTGNDPNEMDFSLLEKQFPGIRDCENPECPGSYYVEKVMEIKEGRA